MEGSPASDGGSSEGHLVNLHVLCYCCSRQFSKPSTLRLLWQSALSYSNWLQQELFLLLCPTTGPWQKPLFAFFCSVKAFTESKSRSSFQSAADHATFMSVPKSPDALLLHYGCTQAGRWWPQEEILPQGTVQPCAVQKAGSRLQGFG